MMNEERRYKIVRHTLPELRESTLDRVGPPIDVEHESRQHSDQHTKRGRPLTLQDLTREHRLFTIGPIVAASRFDRDPVAEFMSMNPPGNHELAPKIIDFSEPFFTGMGVHPMPRSTAVPNLDCRLYAVHNDGWVKCCETIGSFSAYDPKDNYFAVFPFYELQVPDIPAIKKMTVVDDIPLVTVTVFAVESTAGTYLLAPSIYPQRPYLTRQPVSDGFRAKMERIKSKATHAS